MEGERVETIDPLDTLSSMSKLFPSLQGWVRAGRVPSVVRAFRGSHREMENDIILSSPLLLKIASRTLSHQTHTSAKIKKCLSPEQTEAKAQVLDPAIQNTRRTYLGPLTGTGWCLKHFNSDLQIVLLIRPY